MGRASALRFRAHSDAPREFLCDGTKGIRSFRYFGSYDDRPALDDDGASEKEALGSLRRDSGSESDCERTSSHAIRSCRVDRLDPIRGQGRGTSSSLLSPSFVRPRGDSWILPKSNSNDLGRFGNYFADSQSNLRGIVKSPRFQLVLATNVAPLKLRSTPS